MDDDWTKSIPTYYKSSTDFKIGNFQQTVPFHYVEDSWLTDEIINEMERKVVYGY
jgi:hypothetical protein